MDYKLSVMVSASEYVVSSRLQGDNTKRKKDMHDSSLINHGL